MFLAKGYVTPCENYSLSLKNDGWKTICSSEMFPFQVPFVHFCEGSSMKVTLDTVHLRDALHHGLLCRAPLTATEVRFGHATGNLVPRIIEDATS